MLAHSPDYVAEHVVQCALFLCYKINIKILVKIKRYWPKSDFHKPLNVYVVFSSSLLTFMLSFSFLFWLFLCLLFGQNKIQKRSLALVKKHKPY